MSVVRKYQPGGPIEEIDDGLENYLAEYVNSNKFTKKATPLAQQSAKAILELHKSGTLEKALKFDPVTQKYTVDLNEIPEEKQQFFKGSPDVKNSSNVFGQVKDNQESINEALITEYYKYKQKSPTKTELPKATSSGITRSIKPLQDFIVDTEFSGDSASFQRYLESLGSEEAAQKYITDLGKKHLLSYQEQKAQNLLKPETERDIYTDINNFDEVLNSTDLGYSDFVNKSLHLGWDLNSIINPEFWERTRVNDVIDEANSIINTGNEINAGINLQEKQNQEYLKSLGIADQQTQTVNDNILTTNVPDYSWLKDIGKEEVEDKTTYLNEISKHILEGSQPSEVDVRKLAYIAENQEDLSEDDKLKLQLLLDNIRKTNEYKEGGVIKHQSGGNITSDELRNKLKGVNIKVAKGTTFKNLTKDGFSKESVLSGVSVAGDIASMVPVVGAIGGAVTTIADAIKGGTDIKGWEEEDTLKLAANLGFTALSLVGFGGLKTILKASKLANKAVDVSKVAGLSDDFVKLTNTIKKNPTLTTLTNVIETIDKTKGGKKLAAKIAGNNTPEATALLKTNLTKDLGKVLESTQPTLVQKVASLGKKSIDNKVTRTALGFGAIANATTSLGNIAEQAASGNAGNITIEDTGNLLRSGALAKRFLNDRTLKKLLTSEKALPTKKSIVSITDKDNKVSEITFLRGDVPKIKDKYIFKKLDSKEIVAKYNTSKGEKIPSTATVKVEKEVPGQLIQKKAYSEKLAKMLEKRGIAVKQSKPVKPKKVEKKEETPKSKVKETKTKTKEKEVVEVKEKQIYNTTVNKRLTYKGKGADMINKKKEGGILKFQFGTNKEGVPYKSVSEMPQLEGFLWGLGITPGKKNPVSLLDRFKKWNTLPKGNATIGVGGPKIKAGTINVPETSLASNKTNVPTVFNIPNVLFPKKEVPFRIIPEQVAKEAVIPNKTYPERVASLEPIKPKTLTSLPSKLDTETLKQPVSSGDLLKDKISFLNTLKGIRSNIDYTDLANLGMYINTIAANAKIARAQKAAAMEGIVKLPTISNQYFRSSAKFAPFYNIQANNVRSLGKRLSESTSDIDKGFGARLASEQQAGETILKGQQLDQQQIAKDNERQQTSDRQTELQNLGIVGQNLQSLAGARKSLNLIDSNKIAMNAGQFNKLIDVTNRNREIKENRNRAGELYEMTTSPEIKGIQERWSTLATLEAEKKQKFLDRMKENSSTVAEGDWENSPEFFEIEAMKKGLLEESKPITEKISAAKYAMQYGLPIKRAKGGTLAEKKYLIDLKHMHRKELEEQKHYYKMILKDNELLMKSLIKVFK